MFTIDASSIDRSLPVPVGKQLYGLLSYVLSFGDMPKGVNCSRCVSWPPNSTSRR